MSIANIIVSDVDRNFNQPVYKNFANDLLSEKNGNVSYAAVTTTSRFRFDGRSTAYQRSLKSQET